MPLLVRTTLRRALGLFVVLTGHLAIIVYFFPVFAEQKGALLKIAENLGEILARDSRLASASEWGYVASQQFFKFANTLGTGAAVLFAAGAIAGDTQRGTLEILLARPVSRLRVYSERWVAGALGLVLPLLASSALVQPIASACGVELALKTSDMLLAASYEALFLLVFYSAAFTWSVVAARALTVVFGLLFVTIGMYALYLVPEANAWSLYQWTDVETFVALPTEGLTALQWLRPLIATLVFTAAGWLLFRRRLPY
jgi:ABC-2 type transport system permease protein